MPNKLFSIAISQAVLLLLAAVSPAAAQSNFARLHAFGPYASTGGLLGVYTNADGFNPNGWLILSGATLYGTAPSGGTTGSGTVFAMTTNGAFSLLYTFPSDSGSGNSYGAKPNAGLVLASTTLFGTTANGGSGDNGVVFSVSTSGSGIQALHSFTASINYNDLGLSTNSDGANPSAGLILAGATLYGTAESCGLGGNGVVFAYNTNNQTFTVLHQFTAGNYNDLDYLTNSDGANPTCQLLLSGAKLYGTTLYGGTNGFGTVFALSTNGTGFAVLHHFDDNDYNGDHGAGYISAGLVLAGGKLFGIGGSVVYALNTNGSGFTVLQQFSGLLDGGSISYATSGTTVSNGVLYGTAASGGDNGNGQIFAMNTNGAGFGDFHDFSALVTPPGTNSDGIYPSGGLVLAGLSTLYGAAGAGGPNSSAAAGANGSGVLFKVVPPPAILSAQPFAGGVLLSFQTTAGMSYTVHQKTSLATANWTTFTNAVGNNTVAQFLLPATNPPQSFFRLSQP